MKISLDNVGEGICPLQYECKDTTQCTRVVRKIRKRDAEDAGILLKIHYGGNSDITQGLEGDYYVEYCEGVGKKEINASLARLLAITAMSKQQLLGIVMAKKTGKSASSLEFNVHQKPGKQRAKRLPLWTALAGAFYPEQKLGAPADLYQILYQELYTSKDAFNQAVNDSFLVHSDNSENPSSLYSKAYRAQMEDSQDPLQKQVNLLRLSGRVAMQRAEDA